MPRHRIRAQYKQLSQFERGRIIGLKEVGWAISSFGSKSFGSLEDSGKKGWAKAYFSIMIVAIDLQPQKIERIN
ncbi:hypothetical protein TNCV_264391 [Trichonephila clavipes]|nr:hypothetical protein TNCV_264391 [Trichonephila clavipes]